MGLQGASADLAKTYGEENRCPACGAFARIDRDDDFRFVCAVCGAPRIGGKGSSDPEAQRSVAAAAKAKRSAFAWRVASFGLGLPAALTLVLAAVLAPQSFLAAGVLIASGIVLAILATRAARVASTERKKLWAAWTEMWEHAVLALLAERKDRETTAAEVAKELDLPEADAETLLTTLSARSNVRVRVDEESARLVYESDATEPPAEARTTSDAEAEARAMAEAEAEAEASSAAEKAKEER